MVATDCHQGRVPHLIEHPQPARLPVACGQGRKTGFKRSCRGFGLIRSAGKLPQPPQTGRNIGQRPGIAAINRQPHASQQIQLIRRIATLPAHHQIGPQRQDGLHIHAGITAHRGQAARGRRIVAVRHAPDDPAARPGGEQQFGHMRRQADDAAGRSRQFHPAAGVIELTHLGLERHTDLHAEQHQPTPGKPPTTGTDHRHVRPPE